MTAPDTALDAFEEHRSTLTGVAYRMLGRFADAEDVVQEAWLRWSGADRGEVRDARGYLVRITTRLAIDRLRRVQAQREAYVGPWLPEPIATDFGDAVPDTAERAVLADSVSLAVLVVLESLSPLERAVFVLREAFGFPFSEIAGTLDRSEAAVRQLAGRARQHVEERKPRYDVDPAARRDLTERFLAAAGGGSLEDLLALLAPDVRLVGDSGGKAKGPLRVMHTADKIGRFLLAVAKTPVPDAEFRFTEVNGGPALVVLSQGRPDTVCSLGIVDGRIAEIYLMRNPGKLTGVAA
ncbi:RNA polymerase sigma-70 factor (ECF subfamily) [Streptomyces olivoverticillatus]|uniref:RNA polymerase sigma-70 factor (ECF subfamily) n=1 Tax=Streptomyces olivoverticillatus TaxID=66427 RepID=A0A7W7LNX2_9ACTN|nr:RNA polymerase sigma-70 factor (ECF subfamily) [Streptomyces olivoverticillatus]